MQQNSFIIIGTSKVVYSLGTVVPDKPGFHDNHYILPAGYKSSAILPSFVQEGTKIEYFQEIMDIGEPTPLFRVTPSDSPIEAVEDRVSCNGAWAQMLKKISAKTESDQVPDGYGLFGLREPEIRHHIEQLPGADKCTGYEGDAAGVNLSSGAVRNVSDPQEFLRIIRQITSPDPSVPVTELPPDANHPMLYLLTGGPVTVQLPMFISQTVTLHSLGQIVHDRPGFHNANMIFPAGFKSTKKFFSSVSQNGVCEYINEIIDNGSENPVFRVTASDNPQLFAEASSPSGVWKIIRDRINPIRPDCQKSKTCFVNGPRYFGLSHPTVVRLIEQLPGAEKCTRYQGAKRALPGKRAKRAREGEEGEEEAAPSAPQAATAASAPAAGAAGATPAATTAAGGVPTPAQVMMGLMGENEEDATLEFMISKIYEGVVKKRMDAQAQLQQLRALAAENARLTQSLTDTNHNLEAYKSQYEHFYKLFELCLQRVLVLMSAIGPERVAQLPAPDTELASLIQQAAQAQRDQEARHAAEVYQQQQAAASAGQPSQEPMTVEQQQQLAAQQAASAQQQVTVTPEQQAQFLSQLTPEQQNQFQQLPPEQQAQVIMQQAVLAAQQALTPEQQAQIVAQLPPEQQLQLQQMPPEQQASFIAAIHQQSLLVQQQQAQQAQAAAAAGAEGQQAQQAQANPPAAAGVTLSPEHHQAFLQWIMSQGRDPATLTPEEFAACQNFFVSQMQQAAVAGAPQQEATAQQPAEAQQQQAAQPEAAPTQPVAQAPEQPPPESAMAVEGVQPPNQLSEASSAPPAAPAQ